MWSRVAPLPASTHLPPYAKEWRLRPDHAEREARGECTGFWVYKKFKYRGVQTCADVRFCGECSAALYCSVPRMEVILGHSASSSSFKYCVLFRVSMNTWQQECVIDNHLTWPPWSCVDCPACGATGDNFRHHALVHIGDHRRCHGARQCRCVSTSVFVSRVIHRGCPGSTGFLHILFIPLDMLDRIGIDVSDPWRMDVPCHSHCREHGRTVRQSRSWGAFHREIVLDRQLLHAVTCKSLPINEARELLCPCTAVQRPSCIACGADMASAVHAELDMREVLFVNRLRTWAKINMPPAAACNPKYGNIFCGPE